METSARGERIRPCFPCLWPGLHRRCLRAPDCNRNTQGTWGLSCCWNRCTETSSPGHIHDSPDLLTSPRADSGSAVWKQGTETEQPQRQRDAGARRGSPRGCSGLAESAAPALPSAQTFPPASPVSITSSRNANQCICKTWK